MLLGEPPRTQFDLHFYVLGIPVRVHPFFWLVTLLMASSGGGMRPAMAILWLITVFVSILIHELGHALVARYFGCDPWIVLHGFGGLAIYQPRYRDYRKDVFVSFAGPGAGFLFAVIIVGILAAVGHEPTYFLNSEFVGVTPIFIPFESQNLTVFVYFLLQINIWWGLINLLPVYPLDGGQISRQLFLRFGGTSGYANSLKLSILAGGAVAVFALVEREQPFMGLLFAYLAFLSYQELQGGFGGGNYRGGRY